MHTLFEKSGHLEKGNFVQSVSRKGTKFTQRFLGGICLLMCAGILLAGFWPRHFQSVNQVSWLEDQKGIEIHAKYYKLGIIYSPDPLSELIKECIIDKKSVKEEVNRFRSDYQCVKYSYDKPKPRQLEVVEGKKI
jgi:hypothetical protein